MAPTAQKPVDPKGMLPKKNTPVTANHFGARAGLPRPGMRKSFLLVVNPTAGLARQRLVYRVITSLQSSGAAVTTFANANTRAPTPAEVQNGGFDAVIASGGDGTVRELAIALKGSDIPIGLIPTGTGNVLAHEIDLSRHPEALADVLLNGPVISLHGGLANGAPFYLMAGVGFDGAVVQRLNLKIKQKFGKAAYTFPALRSLADEIPRLDVDVDGTAHRAAWVIVTNAKHYGGAFVLNPNADPRKGKLTAILIDPCKRVGLVRALLALSVGRLTQQKGVTVLPCTSLVVRAQTPVPAQIDGDPFGSTPLTVETGGPPLNLIVPKSYVATERER